MTISSERRPGVRPQKDLERGPDYLTQDISDELSNNTAQVPPGNFSAWRHFTLILRNKLFISRENLKLDRTKTFP